MKKIIIGFISTCMAIALCTFTLQAQDERTQRIQASYILSFGQLPQQAEITHWLSKSESNSMSQLMAQHKSFIGQGGYKKEAILNSYKDGWGLKIDENNAQYKWWGQYSQTYSELMAAHIQYFTQNRGEYEKVIRRAYRFVNKNPSDAEVSTWKNSSRVYSYVMLLGYIQSSNTLSLSYKPDNRMTLSNSSSSVTGAIISTKVLSELRSIPGLITNDGGTLVAAGAGNIAIISGSNLLGSGASLVAAGAGNIAINSGSN